MELNKHLVQTHLITETNFYQSNKGIIPLLISNIAFLISPNDIQAISDLLYFVTFNNKPDEFCITIHLANQVNPFANKKWISYLIVLLADPNYLKFRGSHVIFFDSAADAKSTQDWVKSLSDKVNLLGFHKIIFHNIRKTEHEDFRILNIGLLGNTYNIETLLLESEKELHFYLLSELIIHDRKKIEDFTRNVSSVQKSLYTLLVRVNGLNSDLARQTEYSQHLEDSLQSKTEYLAFLLKPIEEQPNKNDSSAVISDVQKIKNFYHYEYEILPLWYKRLGHVLKVIMGKRTFQSLFNDNVSKYKVKK